MPSTPMNERNIMYFPMQSVQIGTDEQGNPIYDNAADAEILQKLRIREIKDGVYPDVSTYLQVMSNNDMTVTVKAGYAHIQGVQVWVKEDVTLTVEDADLLVDRADRVVLRLSLVDREVTLAIKTGDTTLTRIAGQTWELGLADLAVAKNNAVITQAEITDLRLNPSYCGIVSGLMQVDTETIFNQYMAWWADQQDITGYLTVAGENLNLDTEDKTVIGAINETLSKIINPNILINGDFQVWQRGTNFEYPTSGKYTADRWMSGGGSYVNKAADGLSLRAAPAETIFLRQYIENPSKYAGKTMTLSAKFMTNIPIKLVIYADNVLVGQSALIGISTYGEYSLTVTLPTTISTNLYVGFWADDEAIVTIRWCKLEYGNIATPFVSKPLAEELKLCQRYYETTGRHARQVYYVGFIQGYEYQELKRINPTIAMSVLQVIGGANLTFSYVDQAAQTGFAGIVHTPAQPAGTWCYVQFTADAEIYG